MRDIPLRWRHVIINTKSSWLHGDPRGFRDRDHRIHSSGDYKNPPPPGEHAQLHDYMRARAGARRTLASHLRIPVLDALIKRLQLEQYEVVAGSVSDRHAHLLVNLPDDLPTMRVIIGRCKRAACEAVKSEMRGSIWSAGGAFKPVHSRGHYERAFAYICDEQEDDACTWSCKDNVFRGSRGEPGSSPSAPNPA